MRRPYRQVPTDRSSSFTNACTSSLGAAQSNFPSASRRHEAEEVIGRRRLPAERENGARRTSARRSSCDKRLRP
jgi:hypothetical protein